jgi:hypothetical protein
VRDGLDLRRDHLVGLRRRCRRLLDALRDGTPGQDVVPELLSLLDLVVGTDDQVLPRLGNDARVVEVGCVVDEQAQVVVARLVGVVVKELVALSIHVQMHG